MRKVAIEWVFDTSFISNKQNIQSYVGDITVKCNESINS